MTDKPHLTELQTTLLDYITSMAEPTWIMLKEIPETHGDRDMVEAALRDLEARGLVSYTREKSGNPQADGTELENRWALTDAGWELLGLAKPAGYR